MILTMQKLEANHRDLWKLYDLASFAESLYKALLLNKFMRKSWVFFICSKDIFFNIFESWF